MTQSCQLSTEESGSGNLSVSTLSGRNIQRSLRSQRKLDNLSLTLEPSSLFSFSSKYEGDTRLMDCDRQYPSPVCAGPLTSVMLKTPFDRLPTSIPTSVPTPIRGPLTALMIKSAEGNFSFTRGADQCLESLPSGTPVKTNTSVEGVSCPWSDRIIFDYNNETTVFTDHFSVISEPYVELADKQDVPRIVDIDDGFNELQVSEVENVTPILSDSTRPDNLDFTEPDNLDSTGSRILESTESHLLESTGSDILDSTGSQVLDSTGSDMLESTGSHTLESTGSDKATITPTGEAAPAVGVCANILEFGTLFTSASITRSIVSHVKSLKPPRKGKNSMGPLNHWKYYLRPFLKESGNEIFKQGEHVCPFTNCFARYFGFNTPQHLARHISHTHFIKRHICPWCSIEFSRTDSVVRHMKKMHDDSSCLKIIRHEERLIAQLISSQSITANEAMTLTIDEYNARIMKTKRLRSGNILRRFNYFQKRKRKQCTIIQPAFSQLKSSASCSKESTKLKTALEKLQKLRDGEATCNAKFTTLLATNPSHEHIRDLLCGDYHSSIENCDFTIRKKVNKSKAAGAGDDFEP